MKKNLGQSRLLFNELTLDINLIIGNIENEQWITINYKNDLWCHFIKQFPEIEIIDMIKKMDSFIIATKIIKAYFGLSLPKSTQFLKNI
jgi:hypothetical protein